MQKKKNDLLIITRFCALIKLFYESLTHLTKCVYFILLEVEACSILFVSFSVQVRCQSHLGKLTL